MRRWLAKLSAIIELIRLHNCALAGAAVLVGLTVALGGGIPPIPAALAFAAAALISGGGNAINDFWDRKIDEINRPGRPIPSGRVTPQEALFLAWWMFAAGIFLPYFLNPWSFSLAVINSLLLASYAAKLKRRGLAGNLTVGYLVGSTFLFGGLAVGRPEVVSILAAMATLSTAGRELIKDIEDMRGDREVGLETFPIRHGARKAGVFAVALIALAIALSPLPYSLGLLDWKYLALITAPVAALAWSGAMILRDQAPGVAARASLVCKIAMGLGLLAFWVGALPLDS